MTPRVAAVVVNWNSGSHLAACVASLREQSEPVRIVVVDNASTDGSLRSIEGVDDVDVVRNRTNRGYAGGANDGIRATAEPLVFVCNPDVRLAGDHLERLADVLDAEADIGSVQGLLLRMVDDDALAVSASSVIDSAGHGIDRARLFRNLGEGTPASQQDRVDDVFGVTGAAAMHRRAMLDDVAMAVGAPGRPFDEDLFAYFEDVDLDWRARLRGWRAGVEPAAVGWHERGGRGVRRSALVEELNFANRLLVLARHDTWPGLRASALMAAVTVLKFLRLPRGTRVPALRRLRAGWPVARRVRASVRASATVSPGDVLRTWLLPIRRPRP